MKPDFLTKNDIIYLVAPSFGCTMEKYNTRLNVAIKNLESLGYSIKIGPNVYLNDGIAASNVATKRAKEFMDAYRSNAKAILSVGGGETMIEILPYIDFEEIKALKPKWFIGYSDNTTLVYTLATICNVETIYAICAPSFFDIESYEAKDTILMLNGKEKFKGYKYYEARDTEYNSTLQRLTMNQRKFIMPYNYTKPFSGTLIGGCLDVLQFLCGTKYDNTKEYTKKHKDIIFFMEACDLYAIGIRRALFQLKEAGWFNNVRGFIIGRSLHYENNFNELPEKSYIDLLKEYNVPILLNCDFGHIHPAVPIRCGADVKITYKNNNIYFEYK